MQEERLDLALVVGVPLRLVGAVLQNLLVAAEVVEHVLVDALHLVGRDGVCRRLDLLDVGERRVVGHEHGVVVCEVSRVELVALAALILWRDLPDDLADELYLPAKLDGVVLGLNLLVEQVHRRL